MTKRYPLPKPLFDTLENLHDVIEMNSDYLASLSLTEARKELTLCLEFLKSYANSKDTFTAYRRETERLLNWAWLIAQKPLLKLNRNTIREYLEFVQAPPLTWLTTKIVSRFINLPDGTRQANPLWRPFVVKVSKMAYQKGAQPDKSAYQLSNKSIEAIFAVLGSLFSFLQQEEYVEANPVALIRQKKGFIQRQQERKVTRKLSRLQWHHVITAAETLAEENSAHERTLFLVSAFYLLGLRISELSYTHQRMATMSSFAPDKRGLWWFTTVGKGNKMRDVAVPDELLSALKRYREYLNLTLLPHRGENTPLFPKLKGKKGLGSRQIRNIIQYVFDQAIIKLRLLGKTDEAEDLATATVHWLRHTAISNEVEYRPREHIRDDVGHENPATLDKYIDTDRIARHRSAQHKPLKPELDELTDCIDKK
jgi:site-specific recombinase XerD